VGLVNKFLYLCGKTLRLIQKLLNLWLILRSILICLMIGKLHLLLNPKLQKQGVLGNAYFLTLSCNLYSLCTMHFHYVLDLLIPFFYYRGVYHPAEEYVNHAGKSHVTLVDAFRNMQIEEGDQPLENGDSNHEVY